MALPETFKNVLPYNPNKKYPSKYSDFLDSVLQKESEERFNLGRNLLHIDMQILDRMLKTFLIELNIFDTLNGTTPLTKKGQFVDKKLKNSLNIYRASSRELMKTKINSCFAADIPSAAKAMAKQIDFIENIITNPNQAIKRLVGAEDGTGVSCAVLGAIAHHRLATQVKGALGLNNFGTNDPFSVKNLLNDAGASGFANMLLPNPTSMFDVNITGNLTSKLDPYGNSNVKSCLNASMNKYADSLLRQAKQIASALELEAKKKIVNESKAILTDFMADFQKDSGGDFGTGVQTFLNDVKESSGQFKGFIENLQANYKTITDKMNAIANSVNGTVNDIENILNDSEQFLSEQISSFVGKMESINGALGNEALASITSAVDLSDLPTPTSDDLISHVKNDVHDLMADALGTENAKIFSMIVEIESFTKSKQIAQRVAQLKKQRSCIKKQYPRAQLDDIKFLNNFPFDQNGNLNARRLQSYMKTPVISARTLSLVEQQHRQNKVDIKRISSSDLSFQTILSKVL